VARGGGSNDCRVRGQKQRFFSAPGNFGLDFNIIMQRYQVPYRLHSDPNMLDLE